MDECLEVWKKKVCLCLIFLQVGRFLIIKVKNQIKVVKKMSKCHFLIHFVSVCR